MLAFSPFRNNFFFLYLSNHTTFEHETLPFNEAFDIECRKINSGFYDNKTIYI
jgi:hypothetical protein